MNTPTIPVQSVSSILWSRRRSKRWWSNSIDDLAEFIAVLELDVRGRSWKIIEKSHRNARNVFENEVMSFTVFISVAIKQYFQQAACWGWIEREQRIGYLFVMSQFKKLNEWLPCVPDKTNQQMIRRNKIILTCIKMILDKRRLIDLSSQRIMKHKQRIEFCFVPCRTI